MLTVGKLVLNRNPDNFFAETEQVAFHPGPRGARHRLQQRSRCCRDGCSPTPTPSCRAWAVPTSTRSRSIAASARSTTSSATACTACWSTRARSAYEPNSLASGSEFRVDGGQQGFQSFRRSDRVAQGAPPQPQLRRSLQPGHAVLEQPERRPRRITSSRRSSSSCPRSRCPPCASAWWTTWPMSTPSWRARWPSRWASRRRTPRRRLGRSGFRDVQTKLPLEASAALSMEGNGASIATRKVAVLVAGGVEVGALRVIQQALQDAGASSRDRGRASGLAWRPRRASSWRWTTPSPTCRPSCSMPCWCRAAPAAPRPWPANGDAVHFVLEAYKHCKTICVIGEGVQLLRTLGISRRRGRPGGARRGARQERPAWRAPSWRRTSSRPLRGIATGCAPISRRCPPERRPLRDIRTLLQAHD